MGKILLSIAIGALVCAVLGFLMFFALVMFDTGRVSEAVGFGIIVGIACALVGAFIGLAIGIGNLRAIGGAAVGFAATLILVAFYVLSVGTPGRYAYFLSESRVMFVVLTLPTILTGIVTALLKNLIYKS